MGAAGAAAGKTNADVATVPTTTSSGVTQPTGRRGDRRFFAMDPPEEYRDLRV